MDDKTAYELNREVARRILQEVQAGPSSPYADKVVGVAKQRKAEKRGRSSI
jgi:hypothetical protein